MRKRRSKGVTVKVYTGAKKKSRRRKSNKSSGVLGSISKLPIIKSLT